MIIVADKSESPPRPLNVVGLYSHILHFEGLEAISKVLDTRDHFDIPTANLVELARIFLENNFFEFDGKIFHQKLSTIMGTKFNPPLPTYLW